VEVGEEPGYLYTGEGSGSGTGEKRKLGEYGGDEAEGEGFKFEHRDKRAVRDVYDEDWDPKQVLGKARVRVKEERLFGERRSVEEEVKEEVGGLDREGWTGRLEFNEAAVAGKGKAKAKTGRDGLVYQEGGGWVKAEPDTQPVELGGSQDAPHGGSVQQDSESPNQSSRTLKIEPEDSPTLDIKPVLEPEQSAVPSAGESASGGLFKKRRPPPGAGRKK
jgi:WW domain-binding protein 4